MSRIFYLRNDEYAKPSMRRAWDCVQSFFDANKGAKVTVAELKPQRTLDQNARLWAMLTDLSEQLQWPVDGRMVYMTPEDWKHVMTAGLKREQRIAAGMDGGFVVLGQGTSKMTIGEMTELIELLFVFGAERGIRWTDPALGKAA